MDKAGGPGQSGLARLLGNWFSLLFNKFLHELLNIAESAVCEVLEIFLGSLKIVFSDESFLCDFFNVIFGNQQIVFCNNLAHSLYYTSQYAGGSRPHEY